LPNCSCVGPPERSVGGDRWRLKFTATRSVAPEVQGDAIGGARVQGAREFSSAGSVRGIGGAWSPSGSAVTGSSVEIFEPRVLAPCVEAIGGGARSGGGDGDVGEGEAGASGAWSARWSGGRSAAAREVGLPGGLRRRLGARSLAGLAAWGVTQAGGAPRGGTAWTAWGSTNGSGWRSGPPGGDLVLTGVVLVSLAPQVADAARGPGPRAW
jgi:hypothetical protein